MLNGSAALLPPSLQGSWYLSAPKGQDLGPYEGPGTGCDRHTQSARTHPFLFTSFFFSPFSVAEVASVVAAAAPSSLKVDGPGCSSSMTTIVALASEVATVAVSVAVSGSMALERER